MLGQILAMLGHVLRLKCPRCGVGVLYQKPFRMHVHCPHCDLKFEREPGYYVGAIYINYAATVGIAVPGFFLLDVFTSMNIDQQLMLWVPFAVVFPLLFFHHARALWLVLALALDPTRSLYGVGERKSD